MNSHHAVRAKLMQKELDTGFGPIDRGNFRAARMMLDLAMRSKDQARIERAAREGREWLNAYAGF